MGQRNPDWIDGKHPLKNGGDSDFATIHQLGCLLYPLVNVNKKRTGKIHHAIHGKIHEISMVIFHSYVGLPEVPKSLAHLPSDNLA